MLYPVKRLTTAVHHLRQEVSEIEAMQWTARWAHLSWLLKMLRRRSIARKQRQSFVLLSVFYCDTVCLLGQYTEFYRFGVYNQHYKHKRLWWWVRYMSISCPLPSRLSLSVCLSVLIAGLVSGVQELVLGLLGCRSFHNLKHLTHQNSRRSFAVSLSSAISIFSSILHSL